MDSAPTHPSNSNRRTMTLNRTRRITIKKTVKRTVTKVVKKVLGRVDSHRASGESNNSNNDTSNPTALQGGHSVTSTATVPVASSRPPQVYESFASTMVGDFNPWSSQDLVGDDLTASLSELAPLDFSNIHFQDDLFTVDKTEIAEAHEGDTTITDKAGGTEEQVIRAEGDTMDTGSETTDIKEIATETDDIEVDLSPAKRHKKDSSYHETYPSPASSGLKRNRPSQANPRSSTTFPNDQPGIHSARGISFNPFNHTSPSRVIRSAQKKWIPSHTQRISHGRPRGFASPTQTSPRHILAKELEDSDGDISMFEQDCPTVPYFTTDRTVRSSMPVSDQYITKDNASSIHSNYSIPCLSSSSPSISFVSSSSSSSSSPSVIQNIRYQDSQESSTCSLQDNTTRVSQNDGPTLCRSLLPLSDLDKTNETQDKLGLETERHTHNIDIFNTLLNIHSWIVKVSQQLCKLGLDSSLPILPFLSNLTASSSEETATDTTPPPLTGRDRPPLTLADLESPEGYQDPPINLNSKHDQKHAARPEQLSRRIDRYTQGQHQQEPKLHDMWAQHVGFPEFGDKVAPSDHAQDNRQQALSPRDGQFFFPPGFELWA
ncbi:hypothetical protein KI688_003122 [Linnemannia hyalina]|uniref:Uncharacterized protein n=1 Tax=Linnemannia hyalina TaxID=64524 RepID=A0A9P7XSE3_9FUNG|nr:hypothetical protein KI688_003122 [Linnemannia hyalina]